MPFLPRAVREFAGQARQVVIRAVMRQRQKSEAEELLNAPRVSVDPTRLGVLDAGQLRTILASPDAASAWSEDQSTWSRLPFPESAGGVNPGDRRAIHALVLGLRPARMLEVGTHLGASTGSAALALRRTGGTMMTCDISDVNDAAAQPWLKFGSTHSPKERIAQAGCSAQVEFRVGSSLDYLATLNGAYDFIFLDGDHAPATVYRELPLALTALRPGGFVLLHDFYPDGKPLFPGALTLTGPWLAVDRLTKEGARLKVLPLGQLGWPTRAGSTTTSLALVVAA